MRPPCTYIFFAIFTCMLIATPVVAKKEPDVRATIAYNVMETLGFVAFDAALIGLDNLTILPFHIDANIKFSKYWSLSLGGVYRYENYSEEYAGDSMLAVWRNYHEVFLLAGPRLSPLGTGLDGLYTSFRIGLGYARSPEYSATTFLLQPEVGYAWHFGLPGLYVATGVGVLINLPITESPGLNLSDALGMVVHRTIPIVNLSLGLAI